MRRLAVALAVACLAALAWLAVVEAPAHSPLSVTTVVGYR